MTDSRDGKKEAQPAVITSSVRVIEGASIQVAKKPEKVVPCTVKEEQSSDKKTMMGFPTPSIIHDDPPPGVSAPSSEDPRKTVRGVPTVKVADEGEEFSEKPIDSRKTQEGFAVVGGG
ncbi:MAG: hypothetical protein HQ538_02535, partial [Parcubacteria group bacterium]|nr:hypothetical protein [Parcubacteria group bacterium]